jgi:hypothetical protein
MNIWLELVQAASTGRNGNRASPHLTLLIADQYLLRSSLFRLCFVIACPRSLLRAAWRHLPHDETVGDRRSLHNPKPGGSDK